MNIDAMFTQTFEGFKAMKLRTAAETMAVEQALIEANRSFQTRITRNRKEGRAFVVLLVGAPCGT